MASPRASRRAPEPADPFEEIVKDLEGEPDEPGPLEDPVLKRLFPDAYPARHRRFGRLSAVHRARSQGDEGRRGARRPGQARDNRAGRSRSQDPANEVESWLRTLTSVRLAVATRLGINDAAAADELAALPDDDPRSFMVSVYDWLGFAQETLISAL